MTYVWNIGPKSAFRVVYAIPLSNNSDIRELTMAFLLLTNNYISKTTLNIHWKVYDPSVHKVTKVTPSGEADKTISVIFTNFSGTYSFLLCCINL